MSQGQVYESSQLPVLKLLLTHQQAGAVIGASRCWLSVGVKSTACSPYVVLFYYVGGQQINRLMDGRGVHIKVHLEPVVYVNVSAVQ